MANKATIEANIKVTGLSELEKAESVLKSIDKALSSLGKGNSGGFSGMYSDLNKIQVEARQLEANLMTPSRKSRDFSHGMDRPLLSPFMGLFVCFCIFLVIDIFLYNFFAHIAQCTHIVTWRPKMTAPILATSYFWMIL